MGYEADGEFVQEAELAENSVTVTAGEGTTIAIGSYIYDADQFPILYPIEGNVTVDGTEYRGSVQFKRIDGGALTVINVVNIEQYLYSVIGKEMSPSWNIEALKAQAVCARGFAISNYNKFSKYGFNLDTTTTSQVYKGISTETESTRRAVDETKGQVLKHDGKIIQSIYCASMGGATANAENVWGGSYPYLVSVTDPYENPDEATRYSWSITLSADDIKKCLSDAGINVGDITSVEIVSQDDAGYVTELLFTGTEGTHTAKKSSCRTIFGGKLHSQRYTIAGGEETYPSISIISSNGIFTKPSNEIYVQGAGKMSVLSVLSATLSKIFAPQSGETFAAGEYTFNGNGWGHGVGMSQWGAKAMADKGFTYEDILTFYYTGTYLESAY
ncbi:MAG: SpoIID/LytB domain-containing protein [Clostridia bacterium]|nr:SpoIID/LytB domain-containing protein [Clostridia bacterium]